MDDSRQGFRKHWDIPAFFLLALLAQVVVVWARAGGMIPQRWVNLGVYLPATIAIVIATLRDGSSGLRSLLGSLLKVRVAPQYIVFALVYPPAVSLVALLLIAGVSGGGIETDVGAIERTGLGFFKLVVTISFLEEISWVGFASLRLRRWFTTFSAAMIAGVFWGAWYIPLNVAGIQVAADFPNIALVINFIAIAGICSWLYLRTGSAFLVGVMQVVTNYTSLVFPVLPLPGEMVNYYVFLIFKALVAVGLFVFFGPRPLIGLASAEAAAAEASGGDAASAGSDGAGGASASGLG